MTNFFIEGAWGVLRLAKVYPKTEFELQEYKRGHDHAIAVLRSLKLWFNH